MAEPAAPSFGTRAAAAIAEHGPLCVGIDAHPSLLEAWGLPQTPAGLLRFSSLLELSAAYQALAHSTDDHKEAVNAMLEKRRPTFTGR